MLARVGLEAWLLSRLMEVRDAEEDVFEAPCLHTSAWDGVSHHLLELVEDICGNVRPCRGDQLGRRKRLHPSASPGGTEERVLFEVARPF